MEPAFFPGKVTRAVKLIKRHMNNKRCIVILYDCFPFEVKILNLIGRLFYFDK